VTTSPIQVTVPQDDLTVTVEQDGIVVGQPPPAVVYNLVNQAGDQLTDQAGNFLVANVALDNSTAYVVTVPQDDFSVTVPEET
jgi:hypothetical protein